VDLGILTTPSEAALAPPDWFDTRFSPAIIRVLSLAGFPSQTKGLTVIVELQSIQGGSKKADIEIPASGIELGLEGVQLSRNVQLNGNVRNASGITTVAGSVNAEANIACTRCLETIAVPLNFDFVSRFVGTESFGTSGDHELHGQDLDYDAIAAESIDLREVVREQLLLNLPQQVFCREDCRGLCDKCGANRNLIDCKCKPDEIDPRWAALKDLK
jgi:uncharacterized protein